MKREEFERLKEEEKAHLREIQKLKRRLREAERVRSIGKALSDVESAGSMDQLDEALKKVKLEALEGEAKLDIALDSSLETTGALKSDPAEMEVELSKARAAELVRHMKISMGLDEPADASGRKSVGRVLREDSDSGPSSGSDLDSDSASDGNDATGTDLSAPKTIGRMSRTNRGDE